VPADSFAAGDRVRHPKFGEGIVVSSEPSGTDYQVVIAFQGEAGIKKLLLSFAPLEKIEA
jgi:DNA helicase-2/ATP-dependent DNA helicase PcrA